MIKFEYVIEKFGKVKGSFSTFRPKASRSSKSQKSTEDGMSREFTDIHEHPLKLEALSFSIIFKYKYRLEGVFEIGCGSSPSIFFTKSDVREKNWKDGVGELVPHLLKSCWKTHFIGNTWPIFARLNTFAFSHRCGIV